jgi:hypothetical protein
MNTMLTTLMAALLAGAMLLHAESASADKPDAAATSVAGEKLDSGLGDLPHYRHWADPKGKAPLGNHVAGQKLDSGLGELPPYRLWADPTGRVPVRTEQIAANAGSRR